MSELTELIMSELTELTCITADAFEKSDSVIRIMLFSDILAHGCDIENINHAVQFDVVRDKSINMIMQCFDQDARGKNQKKQAIFLIDN